MDINNNQQINTFTKGMNTDVSDMLMDNSQYRYAKNVRLVTNTDSNSGELRLVDGTESTGWSPFPGGTIKAMTSIRDIIVVAGYKNNKSNVYVHKTSQNSNWVCAYESKPGELFGEYLSLVTRYENDKLIKLYIADGLNQLMYINLSPYVDFTGTAPAALSGIDSIAMSVEEFIQPITASLSQSAGQVPGVKVQYAYRYYRLGGAATQISPMSNVVTIYKTSNEGYTETDNITSKSVMLTLPKAPLEVANMMQIYRVSYIQVGQLPLVNLIYDDEILSEYDYLDDGKNVQSIDAAEFLATVKIQFIPTVIESKNNYLFAGNIKYIQSDIDSKIDDSDVRCVSTGDYNNGELLNYNKQLNSDSIMQFNPDNWLICNATGQAETPNKLGGSGRYISWKYNVNPIAVDREGRRYKFTSADRLEELNSSVQSLRQGEVYRYGAIFYDEKGNKSSVKWIADIMSPMLDSTNVDLFTNTNLLNSYQFTSGTVLYPKFQLTNSNHIGISSTFFYVTYQIGIDFTINELPEGISAIEIVRVDRSFADRITITEGLGGFPYRIYHKRDPEDENYEKTQYICPTGYMTTTLMYADSSQAAEDDTWIQSNRAISDNNYLMFASPEYVYQSDDIRNIIKSDKNNIQIDVKYNMHNHVAQSITINNDALGVNSWVQDNKPSTSNIQPPYKALGIGTKDADLTNGAVFIDANFIPKFVRNNIDSTSISNVQDVWCYILGSAVLNAYRGVLHNNISEQNRLISETVMNGDRNTISAYVGLAGFINKDGLNQVTFSIKDIGYPTVPSFDNFVGSDENKTNWANDIIPVGSGTTYSCWGSPLLLGVSDTVGHMKNEDTIYDNDTYTAMITSVSAVGGTTLPEIATIPGITKRYPVLYPTGSTGKCIVIHLDKPMKVSSWRYYRDGVNTSTLSFPLIRLRRTGRIPYGGYGTIKTSTYISHGNMATSGQTIKVFDGDCYPSLFVYHASHAWYEPNMPAGVRQAGIYMIPVESDIDLTATWGDTYNKLESGSKYYVQDKAAAITNGFTQSKDAYLYNTAYNASPNAMTYSATKYTEIDTSNCDTRVHHSQPKTNGEHIDNWLNFRPLDFLDVDSRFGSITNMRLFKDTMLYWQNNATGILSINERTVLNDLSDNQIILGTGDVLSRYDYVSTVYGMLQNQYEAEVQSNNTQYFWDGNNKEILSYAGGTELSPLTKIKNVRSYINNNESVQHPSLSYDNKFNEMIASVVNDGSIVYNEQTQCFTSVYSFDPTYRAIVDDRLYYNNNNNIYRMSIEQPQNATWFGNAANPSIQYVVNSNAQYPKVFDISTFGGRFYGGDNLNNITFDFYTPLKQHSTAHGNQITNREYDFRLDIPRNAGSSYGDRMRGKTMQCEISSNSNSTDFSLQYIITKYRMSWS